jgi:hypothetical protein
MVVAACGLGVSSCGSGGVHLGNNWLDAQEFVLARVNNLVTVVGIDPVAKQAQSLTVIPQQSDDNDVVSPSLASVSDGTVYMVLPKKDGKQSVIYRLDRSGHDNEVVGRLEYGRTLQAIGATVAAIGSKATSATAQSSVVLYRENSWQVARNFPFPGEIRLASGGADQLCCVDTVADVSSLTSASLPTGAIKELAVPSGMQITALDCANGTPIIAGSGKNLPQFRDDGTVRAIASESGRFDAVSATKSSIVAAEFASEGIDVVEINAVTGAQEHRVHISSMEQVRGLRQAKDGSWLVVSDNAVAIVQLASNQVSTFALPGTLLSAG